MTTPITDCVVVWVRDDENVAAYLIAPQDEVVFRTGWVGFTAFAWLRPMDDGTNEREFYDPPSQLVVPAWRVREIERAELA